MGFKHINNVIGYNFRLGEIEASIAFQQLSKLREIIKKRVKMASILNNGLKNLPYLKIPKVQNGSEHLYYYYALKFTNKKFHKNKILKQLNKLGGPIEGSYANLHLLPMFQKKLHTENILGQKIYIKV